MSPHSQCPGLRALQGRKELEKLVKRVKNTRDQMQWGPRGPPPLLIKLAPDLTDADKSDVATVCLRLGVDGLVVSNTTISRPGAVADHPTGSQVRGLRFRFRAHFVVYHTSYVLIPRCPSIIPWGLPVYEVCKDCLSSHVFYTAHHSPDRRQAYPAALIR